MRTAASVGATFKPAGLDKSVGIMSAGFMKDVTDPKWAADPDVKTWSEWMKANMPGADLNDSLTAAGLRPGQGGVVSIPPPTGRYSNLYWGSRFPALVAGLMTTGRHLVGTIVGKDVTTQFPEEKPVLPACYRGVHRLNRDGHTIVLTPHYLEEAELHCNRIAMLKAGRIAALASTRNLLESFSGLELRVRLDRDELPQPFPAQVVSRDGPLFVLRLADYRELEEVLARLREDGLKVVEMELQPPDLEDVFLRLTGRGT